MEVESVYSQEQPNLIHQRMDVLLILQHLSDLILNAIQGHGQAND